MAAVEATRLTPCTAHDLKKGSIGMLKGHPCKIVEVKISKTGKHGHAKCNITGVCQITGKKYNEVKPAHAQMAMARVDKTDYSFSYLNDDGDAVCLDEDFQELSFPIADEKLVEEIKEMEEAGDEVLIVVLRAPEERGSDFPTVEIVTEVKKNKETA